MKTSRFKYEYRLNASKLHKAIGELLRQSPLFKNYEIYQEYPVNKINANYENSSHKFDWVIPKLKLVIEAHGRQHAECISFGKQDIEKEIDAFHGILRRDKAKKTAALEADYRYIVVWHNEQKTINNDRLLELISDADIELNNFKAINDKKNTTITTKELLVQKQKEQKKENYEQYKQSEQYKNKLDAARDFRKTQYRRNKAKLKELEKSKLEEDIE